MTKNLENLLTNPEKCVIIYAGFDLVVAYSAESHKTRMTKLIGGTMILSDVAAVRTGLVTARKKKAADGSEFFNYTLLNLKCISPDGRIDITQLEPYEISEELKDEYLTQQGDVLVRLSAPHTAVLIDRSELCGLVVPSHFAIIRADRQQALPEYILWTLRLNKSRIAMMQNSSGSAAFGTISSGFIASLPITLLPLSEQKILGALMCLSEREQELLDRLSAEKKKYNNLLLNQIYDNMKRGNRK